MSLVRMGRLLAAIFGIASTVFMASVVYIYAWMLFIGYWSDGAAVFPMWPAVVMFVSAGFVFVSLVALNVIAVVENKRPLQDALDFLRTSNKE